MRGMISKHDESNFLETRWEQLSQNTTRVIISKHDESNDLETRRE